MYDGTPILSRVVIARPSKGLLTLASPGTNKVRRYGPTSDGDDESDEPFGKKKWKEMVNKRIRIGAAKGIDVAGEGRLRWYFDNLQAWE